jgi:dTDP-4-dehydrorhamnose 3,5-epimerase
MQVYATSLPEVLILEPEVLTDHRGDFFEAFNAEKFRLCTGLVPQFVQDNQVRSVKGVLRGLHYQIQEPQAKLIRVTQGRIFDVAVDLRKSSPRFGLWTGVELSAENSRQLWVPEGFAHGYLTLSDSAQVIYKTSRYRAPSFERCIAWNDPSLNISWPLPGKPVLSVADRLGVLLTQAETYP